MALGGLHLSVEQVKADKHARNERQVKELQAWIETTLGEKIQGSLIEALKDGQVLCRLINKIAPNTVKKINKEASPFKQRENIEAYLHACQDLGMAVTDCFPVVDLFEDRDTNSVYANLSVLRIIANKLSSSSPRNGANNPSATKGATVILTVSTNNPTGRASADAKSPRIPGPVRRPSAADERRPSNAELRPPPPVSTPSLNESLAAKKLEKYDKELEQELRRWLESVLGETTAKDRSFAEVLKDGVLLCRLINKLKPGSITKINEQRTPFKQMENIEAYLTACKELGIAELDSFNTVDLYEEKNMNLVLVQMSTLATHAAKIPEWKGAVPFKREVVVVGGERSRGDTVERKKHRKEPRALRHLRKGNWESAKGEIVSGKFALKDTDSLGQTALHIAADGGLVDFIQWALTQPGANINAKDKDGYTPLATAVQHLRFDVAELLIEKGADLTLQSNDGSTVLHLLARLPNTPAVVKLVDIILQRRVALTEISDRALDTPLMVAAGSMNDGVLMCLLKRGATLGGTNTLGDTALHKACRLVEQDEAAIMLCKALVDNGIALTPKNAEGRTAFELLPAAARKELERHTAASASDKALSPRSVADLRLQRSKKNMTPRGSYANITPDPVYRIELGESVPLDIELIQMPYYYRWNFAGRKHTNFAGYLDEEHADAIFISVMEEAPGARILVRTKDGTVETVEAKVKQPYSAEAVLNDLIAKRPAWKSAVFLQVDNLKLQSDLLDAEERDPQRTFRFPIGVVYSAAGNKTQWEMWDNEHGSKEFEQFCQFLGERIRLKGWTGYTGSLDVKNDTKGSESIFTKFHGFDIMFHVSTFLPYDPKDERKLARSRMIGNDITMIIYQEGDTPYAPSTMTGGVSHVFVVVRPIKDKTTGAVKYSLSCVSKDYVPAFKPDIPEPALFQLDEVFRNLILAKLINGHSAAQSSPGLRMMYTRPRQAMLADLATVYCKNIDVRIAREKGKVKPRGLLKM